MSPATEKHLQAVEKALDTTKAQLTRHKYPDDLRTVIVAGLIDIMIEHHEAILLLVRGGKIGSAFALARSVFEAMYQGMWLNFVATEKQVQRFGKKGQIPLGFGELAKAIDKGYRAHGFFSDLKRRGWKALNSYTHNGLLQLGRRFTGHKLQPAYSDAEIIEITTSTTTCVLVLVSRFFAVHKLAEEQKQTDELIESYGPVAEHKKRQQP